ncbi:MAG: 30S ribosomal protein S19 [Candidatus Diapherotrites archaeon]|uniref:Small ribosomal subunit protein uS19 n=1 Tax=Candidatus Iainarchaeum sp. TaxID=3101447 RepID=A0A939C5Z0_9ARCH|nr:30S ribosomal protein S19 [Candidatus Diapherotrites archaeon]
MAKKEFTFRGKSLQELQQMTVQEFSKLCNSRARRSLLRGFDKHLLKKIEKAKAAASAGKKEKMIRTHMRDTVIIPQMVGLMFGVHRGNTFEIVEIKPEMLGHYLGEMALTRKKLMHGKAGIGATRSSTAISARK